MPRAIQYGMSIQDFWHGEITLIEAYSKAYLNDISQRSYLVGQNVYNAINVSIANFFGKEKKQFNELYEMPDMICTLTERQYCKTKLEKEQALSEKYQIQNNAWI